MPEPAALSAIALNLVRGIGPRLQVLLLERFETAQAAMRANPQQWLEVPGVGKKIVDEIRNHNYLDMARREWEQCREESVSIISRHDPEYPKLLHEIADPPLVLYQKGRILSADQLAVAIVGSRNCTMYGRRMAEQISAGLARAGITIISGLARGIDGFAHRAALQAGGRTIAVCASGLMEMYPPEHENLAAEIASQGAVISESPLHRQPTRGLFPQRNRIVSGMSLGVVVIEASRTSGTLHTARHAMEQGREVFAVPGQIDRRESEGCHALIRDGVKLIRGVDDILEDLGPLMEPLPITPHTPLKQSSHQPSLTRSGDLKSAAHSESLEPKPTAQPIEIRSPRELNLPDQQRDILNLLSDEPMQIDTLIEQSGLPASRVLSTLTILEMKRFVQRLPGNQLLRLPH